MGQAVFKRIQFPCNYFRGKAKWEAGGGLQWYLCHEAGKLRNGLDLAVKATTLIFSLKTHVVRKREIYSKERFKDEEHL